MEGEIKKTEEEREQLAVLVHQRQRALCSLKEKQKKKEKLEESYGIVGDVDRLLSGNNALRLTFEQFITYIFPGYFKGRKYQVCENDRRPV